MLADQEFVEKIFPDLDQEFVDWNGTRMGQDTRYPSFKRAPSAKGDSFKQASSKRTSLGSVQGGSFRRTSLGSALRVLPSSGHSGLPGSHADDGDVAFISGPTADADVRASDPPAARTDVRVAIKVPSHAPERGAGPGRVGSDGSGAGQSARLASLERKVDDLLAVTGKIDTMEKQLGCLCRHFQVSSAADDRPRHARCES